ncbi:SulP family inorganic anion transporter [uncultured Pseudodesulfovibrio sp.]|uniref:SulP family inorganic anion transporter n=1 Tax=uncultured Pseudodesulfovibrio sp. TaxID=2035858 RepID=UPI0029C67BD5|nr:SulP family inorganic anion transporter [uncultured Pseudodesulfovibrio sp.]
MAVFKCDSCGYEREVPAQLAGKKAKCPDCGKGVAIVEFVSPESEIFVAAESDDIESDQVCAPEEATSAAQESFNLDDADGPMDLEDSEDVVCSECGHVFDAVDNKLCPECGHPVQLTDELPEPTEDDVDLSDLAEEESRQIWDAASPDGEGGLESAPLDAVDREGGWRLLEGNVALNLFGGIVSGALAFFFSVAIAMLVSSQDGVREMLPYVLSISLTAMAVGGVFYSLQTRVPFALVGSEAVVGVVLFMLVGEIYQSMDGRYPVESIIPTLVATLALSGFIVGFVIWLMGKIRVGEFVRFIPMQIFGGVIAGIGLLIIIAALGWMGDFPLEWASLYKAILTYDPVASLYALGPGVFFGIVLFLALSQHKNSLFFLALLIGACAVGYGAELWGPDENIKSLAAPLPYLDNGVAAYPVEILKSGHFNIEWEVIKAHGMYFGALVVLSILITMHRISRLELVSGSVADLNGEYRALGFANMVAGLCGGMPVSLAYRRSVGNHATGGRGPVAGIVAGLICGVALFFSDHVFPFIPRFVVEGLLFYLGLDLLRDWLFRTRSAFTRRDDMWMLWLTFFATVFLGVLVGIGFGAGLALMVTVGRYSRDGAVRNILSGSNHRSNVDRAPAQQRTLKEYGDHIHILRLQGFLFLGSLEGLLKDLRKRLDDRNMLPVEYLIVDFKLVTGLASAANIGFEKLHQLKQEYEFELIITSAPLELEEHLEASGYVGEGEGMFRVFFNLDFALEWCENHVLEAENMLALKQMSLPELLAPVFPEPKYIPALMKVLKRVSVNKGEAVFRQGDESDSMYFVESGRLDVELELEGGKLLRLKKVGPGAVFGEMGIYTFAPRSATVRAAEKCVLYVMTMEKLDAIEKRAPMLVTAVNRYLINMLSERLGDANIKVRDLML